MNILVFNKYDYQIMAKLDIDIGTLGNPSTGDSLRTAFNKVNTNFTELYGVVGDPDSGLLTTNVTNGNIKVQPNGTGVVEIDSLQITDDDITSLLTNGTIAITGNGTGGVDIEGLSFKGTSISSGDSSTINLNENVNVDGNLTVTGNFDLTGLAVGTLDVDNLNLNDNTISSDSNSDINISPGGTGNVVFPGITVADNTITTSGSNANLELSAAGTGDITTDTDVQLISATPFLKIQRTNNANVPGIDFVGSAGTSGAKILFDGTSGTANELIFQTFSVSGGLAEAFRVQQGGASVTGTLTIDSNISITDNAIATSASNADLELSASGTGNIILDTDLVSIGGGSEVGHISSNGAQDLKLDTNGGTNSGSIELKDGTNGDIILTSDGTGDILLKAGGKVGIGSVNQPDTLLHLKDTNSVITLQRTADANTPGLSFQNSNGNVRGVIKLDGTSGTSNEIFMQTYDGSSQAERFRVTHTGAKVSGTLNVDDGISITDNTIATSASNANLELSGNGSGGVTINGLAYPTSDGTVGQFLKTDGSGTLAFANLSLGDLSIIGSTISSPSNADITLDPSGTGSVAIDKAAITGGTITGISNLTVDHVQIKDNFIKTAASNADLEISANGSGSVVVNSADINFAGARITYGTATTTSSSAANIDTFLAATYRSAKYQVSIVDSTNTKFGIYELFVTHDGSNAYINAQGISDTGLDLATFSADINSGSVRVRVVPISDASTVFKFVRTVFTV